TRWAEHCFRRGHLRSLQFRLRPLDADSARRLTGTEDAVYPFWSSDSRSIGFFADGKLKRIDIDGGSPQTLASAVSGEGGTWRDGIILFAPTTAGPIFRISTAGGEAAAVTRLEAGHQRHTTPQLLPDGQHFLYYVQGTPEIRGVYVGELGGL